MLGRVLGWLLLALWLTACEPEATPFVAAPTSTPEAPLATLPPPIRYALDANTRLFLADSATEALEAAALLSFRPDSGDVSGLGSAYDLIAGFGLWPGRTPSPVRHHLLLALNANLPPLDEPLIRAALTRSLAPDRLNAALNLPGVSVPERVTAPAVAIRSELANLGYPDGFELVLLHDANPAVDAIIAQLSAAGFDAQTRTPDDVLRALDNQRGHLAFLRVTEAERDEWLTTFGDAQVLSLLILPISYAHTAELVVNAHTAQGLPLAERQASP